MPTGFDGIKADVEYAVKQLTLAKKRLWTGQGCMDEVSRAMDALERVQEALEMPDTDDCGPVVDLTDPRIAPPGWDRL